VEQKLGLTVCPLSLPIGMGSDFQGIYNIWENNIQLFLEEKNRKLEILLSLMILMILQLMK
jgi:peptide chain release factor 3